eukprot:TRINITY_DN5044_c0_g1_i2.p1 TRINITY_DN5044_c0_g1~~TRINITY_DN5044_c0_g1_i2.p1  ORF type:complete len:278 (-),score=48.23 TRINITY_DN5044_c0_g1_i2:113-946(-)
MALPTPAILKHVLLPGKGRGLVATSDVSEGTLLLIDKPLLCAAVPEADGKACSRCLGDLDERPCEICGEGTCVECSPHDCPKPEAADTEIHKSLWFRLYKRFIESLLEEDEAEVAKKVDWSACARVPTSVYEGWDCFREAADVFVTPVRRQLAKRQILEGSSIHQALCKEGFLDFYLMARANATSVGVRGSAIFLTHACLNHSCQPNAVAFQLVDLPPLASLLSESAPCHPATLVVMAQRHIKEGEEVCISYLQDRCSRAALLEQYGFNCQCGACED